MKKALICLILFLPILVSISRFPSDAATNPGLTRGVEILYEKDRLEKGALPGEAVVFSHRDFLPCCGEVKMDGLIIRETPDSDKGALYLGSECVQKGAFIPADMIEKLRFEPMNAAVESASFRFSFEEGGASRTCLISFAEIPAAENAA